MTARSADTTYWDASAIVRQGAEVYARLHECPAHITLSHLTELELVSAVSKRHARDARRRARSEQIVLSFSRKIRKITLPQNADGLFRAARDLARKHRLGSNDSLHLAACLLTQRDVEGSITLASFDRGLRAAASAEGLRVFPTRLNGE